MITYQDVQAARERIAPYIVRTPLLRVPALDEALGCQVYLKHEGFQPMGAFKLRGAMNKALSLTPKERARGLVCASSGNHAQGVAYAAHKLGCRAVIVMPTNANPVKLAGVKKWGGQVELVGTLSSQREARAAELVREQGMVEVHPYADPYVAAGQGTLALEILEETLQSEEFMNLQEDFADKHCDLFPPEGDLPPQAMQIYQKYVDMIEKNLLSKVQEVEPNFEFDELIPLIKENKDGEDFAHATVFEFLNAAIDFNEFRSLLASYKAGRMTSRSPPQNSLTKYYTPS